MPSTVASDLVALYVIRDWDTSVIVLKLNLVNGMWSSAGSSNTLGQQFWPVPTLRVCVSFLLYNSKLISLCQRIQ